MIKLQRKDYVLWKLRQEINTTLWHNNITSKIYLNTRIFVFDCYKKNYDKN